tara:strand:+ start:1252 stop:1995 length:744 start_codon:yes stop_codon:yes gene_type:complete
MKKLITFTLYFFSLIAISSQSFAQCLIDNSCSGVICPSPEGESNLPTAEEEAFYELIFTLNVPTDTSINFSGQSFSGTINYVTVTSIEGLPASLTIGCSTSDCKILGGTSGCFNISGTPLIGDVGVYTLTVNLSTHYTVAMQDIEYPATFTYILTITKNTSGGTVNSLTKLDDNLIKAYPNPTTDVLNILSENLEGQYELMNSSGTVILSGDLQNKNTISTNKLTRGTYYLRITSEDKVLTKKVLLK